ncbi:MAG TPA: family 16 glycoside hydrolase, partial [Pirellulales bacterium]
MMLKVRFILLACAVLNGALALAANSDVAPVATAGQVAPPKLSGPLGKPIQLFNGTDLAGWIWYQRPPKDGSAVAGIEDVWSVKDGILHTTGKPTGYIRTDELYENYVLTVEQRHVGKGNGGVLFAITGPDKVWPHCLEAQGANGEEGDIRNIADFKLTMDPDRVEPKRLRRIGPSSEKPPGEWETIEVIVDRGNQVGSGYLTVTVNGKLQNIATYTESLAGQIGLQSEGGEMEFRKVELTPIKTHNFAKWEKEIADYGAADRKDPPPKGAVLFTGASTIRRWTTLQEDFPDCKVINRGFGGSETLDCTHFANRIIFPYEPKV